MLHRLELTLPGFDGWDDDSPRRKVKVHLRTRPNGMDGEWSEFAEQFDWSVVMNKSFECSFGLLMSAQLHKFAIADVGAQADIRGEG